MKALSAEAKKAIKIGSVCICTYMSSFLFRNLLSVFTPSMLETGLFTKDSVALLTSANMISYAAGQLINGMLGDYFKPRFMVMTGLMLSGAALILFPVLMLPFIQVLCFGLLGFGLSMLRGPLVKVISENSLPKYARISCVFLSVSYFVGPLLASLCSVFFDWKGAFILAGCVSFAVAFISFYLLLLMERRGLIVPLQKAGERRRFDLKGVFQLPDFWRFIFLGMIIETVITSIGFWIPTYLNEHLGFSQEDSGMLYSLMSLLKAVSPFVCIFILPYFRDDCVKVIKWSFTACMIMYAALFFLPERWVNVGLFTLARMVAGIGSAAMWSVYIPSLGKSGRVSSANGTLDCAGYVGAAIANLAFAAIMQRVGWNGMLLAWAFVFALGVGITLIPGRNT